LKRERVQIETVEFDDGGGFVIVVVRYVGPVLFLGWHR
jgi:hypothetical protein